ncbi:phosphate/sulfate permease [Pseudoxanthomonas winnipegensis]|nr:phosphate/sulfate permease [Pseudoxanthomonas winnipegensis]
MLTLVLVVILAALIFEFINGFHDTANSIATVVSTKVLAPGWAVALAAVTNLIGALTGTAVAATIATGLIDTNVVAASSQVILCALLGGIVWNLITWWKGLPSSSSHALIGGLCGAALAAAHNNWDALIWSESAGTWVKNKGLLWKVFVPMVTSPIAGFVLGVLVMLLLWAIIAGMARAGGTLRRLARPRWVNAFFGKAQIASAAYMGYAHGHNDAQKTMGIIALTLMGAQQTGALDDLPPWLAFLHPQAGAGSADVALWIVLTCAVVMAAGTRLGRLEDHQDPRPQDGQAAPDPRFRGRDQLGHDPHRGGAFRHAGVDHAQHLHRDHGRGLRQESEGAEDRGDRAHRVGLDPDHPGRRGDRLWVAVGVAAGGLGVSLLALCTGDGKLSSFPFSFLGRQSQRQRLSCRFAARPTFFARAKKGRQRNTPRDGTPALRAGPLRGEGFSKGTSCPLGKRRTSLCGALRVLSSPLRRASRGSESPKQKQPQQPKPSCFGFCFCCCSIPSLEVGRRTTGQTRRATRRTRVVFGRDMDVPSKNSRRPERTFRVAKSRPPGCA